MAMRQQTDVHPVRLPENIVAILAIREYTAEPATAATRATLERSLKL
jgi:hypothetical protein